MKKTILIMMITAVLTVSSLIGCITDEYPKDRYRKQVFSEVDIKEDVVYGQAYNYNGELVDLLMDIYEPRGDTAESRALVIFIHGGGFVSGDKADSKWKAFCTLFAKMGYVTASINYRLQPRGHVDTERAVTEAMYDAKAAVRYFKANAGEYRVDPNRIALVGSSAGAITALHATYLREAKYEGDSGNSGFSSNVTACVDLWGGLYRNVTEIDSGEPPVLIIHGTEDEAVPFSEAENISQRCKEVGVFYSLHPLKGEGHAPWDRYKDFLPWIIEFLYKYCANRVIATSLSIGFDVGGKSQLDFLDERMIGGDTTIVKPHLIDLLDEIVVDRKHWFSMQTTILRSKILMEDAVSRDTEIIGCTLENPCTQEEMVKQEQTMYNLMKQYNLLFMLKPALTDLVKHYVIEWIDIISTQHLLEDLQVKMEGVTHTSVNTNVNIQIQLFVDPSWNGNLSIEGFLGDMKEIEDSGI